MFSIILRDRQHSKSVKGKRINERMYVQADMIDSIRKFRLPCVCVFSRESTKSTGKYLYYRAECFFNLLRERELSKQT